MPTSATVRGSPILGPAMPLVEEIETELERPVRCAGCGSRARVKDRDPVVLPTSRTCSYTTTWDSPPEDASLREGLADTLTVNRLGVTGTLLKTVESTNPIESMIEIVRHHAR